jgi:hypothetical protein
MGRVDRAQGTKETWRSRTRAATRKGEGKEDGCEAEMVSAQSREGGMMRPKFDDADLALLEVDNESNELVIDLIREVRIYQDLLATKQVECSWFDWEDGP